MILLIWFYLSYVISLLLHHVAGSIDLSTGYLFPIRIPSFHVRRDGTSHEPVVRGRFELLGGLLPNSTRSLINMEEFKRALQCAPNEPALHERFSFIKMAPFTKKSVKLLCVWAEEMCSPWKRCEELLTERYEKGEGNSELQQSLKFNGGRLLRIHGGKLYLDYPWKLDRFLNVQGKAMVHRNIWEPIVHLLNMLRLDDAVWFHAEERLGFYQYNFPMPAFSSSPSFKSGECPELS